MANSKSPVQRAKEKDIVEFLSKLGYEPSRKSGHHYWYNSPLHEENTPSFKVNVKLNRWYDFGGIDGTNRGGNLVDFGVQYFKCSVKEFLHKMDTYFPTINLHEKQPHAEKAKLEKDAVINVLSVKTLTSFPLIRYLNKRHIPRHIADQYCKEVTYIVKGNQYYSIGFKNDQGGYAMRNEHAKSQSMPNTTTFIDNGAKELVVFEGFFNFLSYKTLYDKQQEPPRNYLILNSIVFFDNKLPLMQEHTKVHLFLDNDTGGQNCVDKAMAIDKKKFIDERGLYKNYNDLNDWLINFGLTQKQGIRQHL